MALTVSCRAIGLNCDFAAVGSTVDEIRDSAATHGMAVHGVTPERVKSDEWRNELRSVMRNISRPSGQRAS